ncbi:MULTISPECIES: TetR/AcrR family transcriptional regulator [Niastella]|uniref:TetR/AcrR family transcriptional regulator n=1 Tax=Niastella soli TaxID=2821487 RepID=A0ABS3YY45_9BACT|nr:TetR/AcrR family transcriptional regulator [Niastella soli]MBO9202846.1 TetR/AcrR family transcriptional regulator [Niastella soli]
MKESTPKTRILDVASRLFYEQGYNSTGINQIIDEAAIARGSLYNHFPSKRDLLAAYIERAEDIWFTSLEKHLETIKDPKARLLALFDFRKKEQHNTGFRGCQFAKVVAEVPKEDLPIFEQVSKEKDKMKRLIKKLLSQIDLQNPAGLSIDMLCESVFLLLEGATVAASLYKKDAPIKNAKTIAAALL